MLKLILKKNYLKLINKLNMTTRDLNLERVRNSKLNKEKKELIEAIEEIKNGK